MSKVAIVGYGFVGKATEYFLRQHTDKYQDIEIQDPALGKKIKDWKGIEYAIICVPTPLKGSSRAQRRKLDTEIVDEVC